LLSPIRSRNIVGLDVDIVHSYIQHVKLAYMHDTQLIYLLNRSLTEITEWMRVGTSRAGNMIWFWEAERVHNLQSYSHCVFPGFYRNIDIFLLRYVFNSKKQNIA